jgi:rSAM/selenodomain-associated transferase 1
MTESSGGLVQVFARAPVPGQAKTRLIPALGAAGAARLHAAMVRDTLVTLVGHISCAVELWCAPDAGHPFFEGCAADFGVTLGSQHDGDLGARMHHALCDGLRRHPWVLLVGCDCPELQAADIQAAAAELQVGRDAVLGPAMDGGYYLVGLRRPMPALFDDMPWGSDRVMALTAARLAAAGADWRTVATRRDLDRPADLLHFPWLNPQATR